MLVNGGKVKGGTSKLRPVAMVEIRDESARCSKCVENYGMAWLG